MLVTIALDEDTLIEASSASRDHRSARVYLGDGWKPTTADGQPVEGPAFVDTPEEAVRMAFDLANTASSPTGSVRQAV
jgi:hypothetical protein